MTRNEIFGIRNMIISIFFVVFIVFLFSIKLFSLQIVENDKFSLRSMRIIYRDDPIPAQRGRIFARDGENVLAENESIYQVKLDISLFPSEKRYQIFSLLEKGCRLEKMELLKIYTEAIDQKKQTITLIEKAEFKEIVFVSEQAENLPGIYQSNALQRNYPDNGSLSHLIGYLGRISSQEYKLLAADGYSRNSLIGKQGLEKQYDTLLKGKTGFNRRTVDSREKTVTEEAILEPPVRGSDLVLTIDKKIQLLCEKSLGNRSGSVVVLKPHSGEILSLVSWPWYDNNFITSDNSNQLYQQYLNNPQIPLLNRVIQSSYAPASTFKIIMSTAILETGVLDPNERIYCPGYKKIGRNDYFFCHKRSGHGSLNLGEAVAQSCNVYFYTAGYEYLGPEPDTIKKYAHDFGLGEMTGIDIPGETSGLVPDAQWMAEQRDELWVGGDTVNISIGQGNLLVTPLQLATAVSMVCNRGKIIQPHLMKESRDPDSGKILDKFHPEVISQVSYKPDTLATVAEYMRRVVTVGTARYIINTKAVKAAGKTGTAEVGRKDAWHSWFVCFAPWDAPPEDQVVIVVMVEAENEWEFWSAKAANIILQGIFADQNYEEAISTLGVWYVR